MPMTIGSTSVTPYGFFSTKSCNETMKKTVNEKSVEYSGTPQFSRNGPVPFIKVQGHANYQTNAQRQARSPSLHSMRLTPH